MTRRGGDMPSAPPIFRRGIGQSENAEYLEERHAYLEGLIVNGEMTREQIVEISRQIDAFVRHYGHLRPQVFRDRLEHVIQEAMDECRNSPQP